MPILLNMEVKTLTDHYFSRKPTVASEPQFWTFSLVGITFKFKTDSGVFSKKEVDFGSRLLIEQFKEADIKGNILDVGCGYGPIGLALAKKYENRHVELIDINIRAVELAKENAISNGVDNVQVYQSDLFEHVQKRSYASIVTNPPIRAGKKVVFQIYEESFQYLADKGELWVVIQKKQGAPSTIEKLQTLFSEVEIIAREKGYFIIKAKKQ